MTDTQAVNLAAGQSRRVGRIKRYGLPAGAIRNYVLVIAVILLGWSQRDRGLIDAESGLGYWLGIAGGSLMLLLLLYPLRKRWAHSRWMGATRHWFRLHMLFGVLGPLLILYHCNFQLGSTNSTVALISMLLVATSGVVGLHFYAKIHRGLFGSKANLKELQNDLASASGSHGESIAFVPLVAQKLDQANQELLVPVTGLGASAKRALLWGFRSKWMYWSLARTVKLQLHSQYRPGEAAKSPAVAAHRRRLYRAAKLYLRENLECSRKVAEFSLYERLFALWHVFHLPIFLLMILTAFAHVLAVHMY